MSTAGIVSSSRARQWEQKSLAKLLPDLDGESIDQILTYTATLLTAAEAAEHLKALLGDTPRSLEFISSYNAHRFRQQGLTDSASHAHAALDDGPPRRSKQSQAAQGRASPSHALPSRQIQGHGDVAGGYQKGAGDSDARTSGRQNQHPSLPQAPPSAAGLLLSDLPNVKTKQTNAARQTVSTSGAGTVKAKATVTGGVPGKGASAALDDLDSAIRSLELQTNPKLSSASSADRNCDCNATRHPLLEAAPNCLRCGKIICVKQGIGPCTFCNHPLLSADDVHAMIETLKQERGQQRMQVNNASHRRADVTSSNSNRSTPFTSRPSTPNTTSTPTRTGTNTISSLDSALQHRNKLLTFQSQNAQRTTVHDEAADIASVTDPSIWASPAERARQLKQQQAALREQEWQDKPEWEKRTTVLNIQIGGGSSAKGGASQRASSASTGGANGKAKASSQGVTASTATAVKSFDAADPVASKTAPPATNDDNGDTSHDSSTGATSAAFFSNNPLLRGRKDLVRPLWKPSSAPSTTEGAGASAQDSTNPVSDGEAVGGKWNMRVVQDDVEDNEALILDGGVYGHATAVS